jgi:hypothetical protein
MTSRFGTCDSSMRQAQSDGSTYGSVEGGLVLLGPRPMTLTGSEVRFGTAYRILSVAPHTTELGSGGRI